LEGPLKVIFIHHLCSPMQACRIRAHRHRLSQRNMVTFQATTRPQASINDTPCLEP
jgi:hypothetical protein